MSGKKIGPVKKPVRKLIRMPVRTPRERPSVVGGHMAAVYWLLNHGVYSE